MSDACCSSCETHAHEEKAAAAGTAKRPAEPTWPVLLAGALIGAGALTSWLGHPGLAILLYVASIAGSISTPARRAWRAMRSRILDINVLMLIAVAGAAVLGDWIEAASVVWLFGIAQWLETRSMERARRAIRSLVSMTPSVAFVRRDGIEREIAAADVGVGDVVIIRPGERIAVDGVVIAGESAVNQAPVTGESWPADKQPGFDVFAGTINGAGALEIHATRIASDSTLARIIHLVEHAQTQRAPVQAVVDRFARYYTPAVVVLAVLLATVPALVTGSMAAFSLWGYRALALLVVACPCALVISTPVSIVSALTAAARAGVLIKGGSHLQRLGGVRCVAFDKTGTLTRGRVTVTDVVAVGASTARGVLSVAAALESRSEHPIGRAIVDRARTDGLAVAPGERFRALPGRGAEATIGSAPALVGSHRLFEERQMCTPSLHARVEAVESSGATPVLVGHDGVSLGVISLTDEMRDEGRQAVAHLRDEGIARVVLLTGDVAAHAAVVRDGIGLDEAHAGLLPGDKVDHVARLRKLYGPVAMVGDGVNDAPAMAAADVGIAMGAAGTDVAIETADVALMSDDLRKLPYTLRLGRAARNNIRVNLGLAIGMKLAFVVLAASGLATLWMAVLADTGASLVVTANSLRLLRVK